MHGALALWASLLCRQAGQSEVVVGFPYANREHPLLTPLVGYFVNTLAARVTVDSAHSFRTTVSAASRVVLGALAHGDVPFVRVVQALDRRLHFGCSPVYQTMLMWEEAGGWYDHRTLETFRCEVVNASSHQAAATNIELDLIDGMNRSASGLIQGCIKYSTEAFALHTVCPLLCLC